MSRNTEIGPGVCLGIGGTNARSAWCISEDIAGFESVETPQRANYFFKWMAGRLLQAAHKGAEWAVIGVPGPVEARGTETFIGPFANIPGLRSKRGYLLEQKLAKADSACSNLAEQGFRVVAVNDGDLAAQAAALVVSQGQHDRVADIILGTGVGGAAVYKQPSTPNSYAPIQLPFEIGHIVIGEHPAQTFENTYSGTAIEEVTGLRPEELPPNHPVWRKLGLGVGQMVTIMGTMAGAELVVFSGGVGIGSYENYRGRLQAFMEEYRRDGNDTQKKLAPEIRPAPRDMIQTFEMYGAAGVIRYLASQELPVAA